MRSISEIIRSLRENEKGPSLLCEHHIEGLLYSHLPAEFPDKKFQQQYKNQWIHNSVLVDELSSMSEALKLKGIEPTILKGMHLLEDIYQDKGSRFMSDIDLLIAPQDQQSMNEILLAFGFKKNFTLQFYGNQFKSEWSKKTENVEINIEIHTRLFYHLKQEKWNVVPSSIDSFKKLAPEDLLIHLCGHLAFQHNFQKLYWLFDIYFFLEKFEDQLDWQLIYKKSKSSDLLRAIQMCLWAVSQYMNPDFNIPDLFRTKENHWWKSNLTLKYLLYPEKNKTQYFIIKHLTKDHLYQALYYDLTWLWHYKISRLLH